jgi:hypothetical protein
MRPERAYWTQRWLSMKPRRMGFEFSNWRERGVQRYWTFGMIRAGEERR